jgi:hypothetical protein
VIAAHDFSAIHSPERALRWQENARSRVIFLPPSFCQPQLSQKESRDGKNDRLHSPLVTAFREYSQQHGFDFHAAYLDLLDAVGCGKWQFLATLADVAANACCALVGIDRYAIMS